jgi:PhnB protein
MSIVSYLPAGYHTVTPYLTVKGLAGLIEFLKTTFDATEKELLRRADGSIHHAELQIGDSVVMMGEATGEWKPTGASLYVYVPDTDATYQRALAAGATSLREPVDQFYGDRSGGVQDAWGHAWWLATHKEDMSKEEMERRAAQR